MQGNTFGTILQLTTFGESHGKAIGGIIAGVPSGLEIPLDFIQKELDLRRPGQSSITTSRNEKDKVEILSGLENNISTGMPIGFIIFNEDKKSNDYEYLKDVFRPGHADFTYHAKYGIRSVAGGGRSSARETACRVVGGAIAKLLLKYYGIELIAYVEQVEKIKCKKSFRNKKINELLEFREKNSVRCPDKISSEKMIKCIENAKYSGNTVGGIIYCKTSFLPVGLGEPVFNKLQALLAHAMLSINAVKGFEYGKGFESVNFYGSKLNDIIYKSKNGIVKTKTNNAGGIAGGISNGMPIYFRVAFKPVSTVMNEQESIDKTGNKIKIKNSGRHDPCVLPRAVPIVEAMTALVLADSLLQLKLSKL